MADDQLIVRLLAEVGQLKTGMAEATRTVQTGVGGIQDQLRRLGETQRDMVVRWNQGWELAGRVSQVFSATWEAAFGSVIRRGEEFQALGRRMGESVGELSKIGFAASQAGVDLGDLTLAYRSLARALVEAKDTSSQAFRTLTQGLGYTTAELARLRALAPSESILEVGRALEQFEDGAEKAAAGQTLFGRAFQTTMVFLRDGEEEIRKHIEIARLYGVTMEQDVADASDRVGDAFARLSAAREGFFQRLFGDKSLLDTLAQALEDTADELAAMGRAIPESELQALRDAVGGFAQSLRSLIPDIAAAVAALKPLLDGLKWLIDNREAVMGATAGALGGGLAAGPVGAVVGGLGGARAGGILGAGRQADDAALTTVREQLAEAQEGLRRAAGGVTGLGMTLPGGAELPSTDLGSASVLPRPVRPPLAVPQEDTEADEAKARREAYEAMLREQERALASEQDSAARRLEIVQAFSERIKQTFGAESEEYDKQKLVVIRAEQAVGQERYQTLLRDQERDLIAVKNNADARLAIVRGYTERVKTEFGEESDEYQKQLTVQRQAEQAAADQKQALAVQRVEAERDAALRELELKKQAIDDGMRLGTISQRDGLEQLRAYHQERLAIILNAINQERALYGGGEPGAEGAPGQENPLGEGGSDPQKLADLDAQEGVARGEAAVGEAGLIAEEQMLLAQSFEQVFGAIAEGWDRTVLGLIQGTQTWQQATQRIGTNMVAQMSSNFLKILARWLALKLAETAAQVSSDATKTTSVAAAAKAKSAIETPAALKSIMRNAAAAAAGAANAVASIPYIGPILAPIAAATTFAVVMGFGAAVSAEGGMAEVGPEGAFARLHPKEMVLPSELAQGVRRMAGMAGEPITPGTTGADGVGQTVVHNTFEVSMMDARGARDFFERHGHVMADELTRVGRLRNRNGRR